MILWAVVVGSLLGGAMAPARGATVPGQVVVGFEGAEAARNFQRGRAASLGLGTRTAIPALGSVSLSVPVGQEEAWAERLRREPGVRYAELEAEFHAARMPDDSLIGQQGTLVDVDFEQDLRPIFGSGAREAWDYITDSGNMIIAILDTGFDFRHPDLAPNIFHRPRRRPERRDNPDDGYTADTLGWNFIANNNDPTDDAGHGTAVAGVLGARGNNHIGISGALWKTQMLAVKVLDAGLSGTGSGIAAGVVYAVDAGAGILNLSLSGDEYSTPLYEALSYARSNGVLAVVAAGNDGRDIGVTPAYPASFELDNVVPVASKGVVSAGLLSSSNFGGRVHIMAYGQDILTTSMGGQYARETGTSFAAPLVAAAAAMYWTGRPLSRYDQVANAVYAAGEPSGLASGRTPGLLSLPRIVSQVLDDRIPPGLVTDLHALPADSNSVLLRWTATGEDGDAGRADSYDIRWSTSPILEKYFEKARVIPQEIVPSISGGQDSVLVTGLPCGSQVYFALLVRDRVHNHSPISNYAAVTIRKPPAIVLFPDAIFFSLHQGGASIQTVKILNAGQDLLIGDVTQSDQDNLHYTVAPRGTHFEIAPGDSGTIRIKADAANLSNDVRLLTAMLVATNDPLKRQIAYPVTITVGGVAASRDSTVLGVLHPTDPRPAPTQADRFAASIHSLQHGATRFNLGAGWLSAPASQPRILDVTGREVARLALNAAATSLSWDGSSTSGRDVASGIYFLKLEAPGRSRVLRFVRIR